MLAALERLERHMGGVAEFLPRNAEQRSLVAAYDDEHEEIANLLGVQAMVTPEQERLREFVAIHAPRFPGVDFNEVVVPAGTLGVASVLELDIRLDTLVSDERLGDGRRGMQISKVSFYETPESSELVAALAWAGMRVCVTPYEGVVLPCGTHTAALRSAVESVRNDMQCVRGSTRLLMPLLQYADARRVRWLEGLRVRDDTGTVEQEVGLALCGISIRMSAGFGDQTVALGSRPHRRFGGPLLLWVERWGLSEPLLTAVLDVADSRVL